MRRLRNLGVGLALLVLSSCAGALQRYQWPPEAPSSRMRIDRESLGVPSSANQYEVWLKLRAALETTDHSDLAVYSAPNGFAIVTRLEAVDRSGRPLPGMTRFRPPDDFSEFSFVEYIRQLFFAPKLDYRVVCFFVTDKPFTPSLEKLTFPVALARYELGAIALPREPYSTMPFTDAHEVHVFVYELHMVGDDVVPVRPGRLLAEEHLRGFEFLDALARGP